MTSYEITQLNIDLDLAFKGVSQSILEEPIDSEEIIRLTHSDLWHKDLINWINLIRSDLSLNCPVIVREAKSISLGLEFTDDEKIAALNKSWRHKPEATDVLSFPAIDDKFIWLGNKCLELGDIIISVPTAQKQAKKEGHGLNRELRWLVSHGLLHLLGWDHLNAKKLQKMLTCQERLLDSEVHLTSIND